MDEISSCSHHVTCPPLSLPGARPTTLTPGSPYHDQPLQRPHIPGRSPASCWPQTSIQALPGSAQAIIPLPGFAQHQDRTRDTRPPHSRNPFTHPSRPFHSSAAQLSKSGPWPVKPSPVRPPADPPPFRRHPGAHCVWRGISRPHPRPRPARPLLSPHHPQHHHDLHSLGTAHQPPPTTPPAGRPRDYHHLPPLRHAPPPRDKGQLASPLRRLLHFRHAAPPKGRLASPVAPQESARCRQDTPRWHPSTSPSEPRPS